jgi:hypothetical protein
MTMIEQKVQRLGQPRLLETNTRLLETNTVRAGSRRRYEESG